MTISSVGLYFIRKFSAGNTDAEHWTDAELQELISKAQSRTIHDISRAHYVLQNGFLFLSVPDGQKGQKWQLVIPARYRE